MFETFLKFALGLLKSKQNKVYLSIFILCTGLGYGFYQFIAKPNIEEDDKVITDSLGRDLNETHRDIKAINKKLDDIIIYQQQQTLMLFQLQGKR